MNFFVSFTLQNYIRFVFLKTKNLKKLWHLISNCKNNQHKILNPEDYNNPLSYFINIHQMFNKAAHKQAIC